MAHTFYGDKTFAKFNFANSVRYPPGSSGRINRYEHAKTSLKSFRQRHTLMELVKIISYWQFLHIIIMLYYLVLWSLKILYSV